MHDFSSLCSFLGFGTIFYIVAQLAGWLAASLDDSNPTRPSVLHCILAGVYILCSICSFPTSIILHYVSQISANRLCDAARKEERERLEQLQEINIRSAVGKEHDRLVSFYRELMDIERDKARMEEAEKWSKRVHEILNNRKNSSDC